MSKIMHRGHAISTTWHPIPELGNWPLDHVFVSTEKGDTWGCFGRALQGEPTAKVICEGFANIEWVKEIAGPDCGKGKCGPIVCESKCCAGVQHELNGVCHSCANRLLLPAGVDVQDAPGNEIVVPIYGKYGLGLADFVTRVKDAAFRVNSRNPDSIRESEVEAAVQKVLQARTDEYEIIMNDVDTFLHVKCQSLSVETQAEMKVIYSKLYDKRQANYEAYVAGRISADTFKEAMRIDVTAAFSDIRDLLGKESFRSVFKMPSEVATAYLFARQ